MAGKLRIAVAAAAFAVAALAGCVEDTGGTAAGVVAPGGDGLSGTPAQFDAMTAPCIDQAARLTGFPAININIAERIRTGGGPLLVLDVGGRNWSCRTESDGSVTVFSEFAN